MFSLVFVWFLLGKSISSYYCLISSCLRELLIMGPRFHLHLYWRFHSWTQITIYLIIRCIFFVSFLYLFDAIFGLLGVILWYWLLLLLLFIIYGAYAYNGHQILTHGDCGYQTWEGTQIKAEHIFGVSNLRVLERVREQQNEGFENYEG